MSSTFFRWGNLRKVPRLRSSILTRRYRCEPELLSPLREAKQVLAPSLRLLSHSESACLLYFYNMALPAQLMHLSKHMNTNSLQCNQKDS